MSKIFFCILFSLSFYWSKPQNSIKTYVQNNASEILTVEPDSTNYSDLESIGVAIGDARIVMLGEQYHGDAATFLAKSRLVKYLHEKKGFDVLAFESDFYALNEGWDRLPKMKKEIDSFMYKNPFQIWGYCFTCNNLFYDYIAKTFTTHSPIQVTGFDCQVHGDYSTKNLVEKMKIYLDEMVSTNDSINKYAPLVLKLLDSTVAPKYPKIAATCELLIKGLEIIYKQVSIDAKRDGFWLQVIKNLLANTKKIKAELDNDLSVFHIRDMQMADNIDWLCKNKYKDKKIIIWAHNAHIAKNSGDHFNYKTADNNMMGSYLDKNPALKDQVYRIGFTSYEGSAQWATKAEWHMKLQKPLRNSFENWIDKKYEYAFVDFKRFRELNPGYDRPFFMKGSIYDSHKNYWYPWTNTFEGIFFIREMYGCKFYGGSTPQ